MEKSLIDIGVTYPSGKINKDKINLVAGAITQPFAEMVWVTTGGDMETINRLTVLWLSMNNAQEREKLFQLIQALYGLLGLRFSDEAEMMIYSSEALEYFIFSFLADSGEIIKDYLADNSNTLS